MSNKENLYAFLKANGFKLINKEESEYFHDYYDTFTDGIIELRFSSSKSCETIDICSIGEAGNWFDLALVKALLYHEQELKKATSIKNQINFLKKEIKKIKELFSISYPSIRKKLHALGDKRARQMFPGMIK